MATTDSASTTCARVNIRKNAEARPGLPRPMASAV
jgi:hypothetical protein